MRLGEAGVRGHPTIDLYNHHLLHRSSVLYLPLGATRVDLHYLFAFRGTSGRGAGTTLEHSCDKSQFSIPLHLLWLACPGTDYSESCGATGPAGAAYFGSYSV